MAHNPQGNQGHQAPQGNPDPAGSTQMFRAFVDEAPRGGQPQQTTSSSGPRVGLIVGVLLAIVIVAGVAWLALS
ncbi:hypothetical protein ABZS76_25900 [Streptomyces sp. NPDC005562]|uniref:hypothetical protein n=1 Tax=unclassified Streptomyces TaxID=2593676 RepID=UPI0033A8C5BB